MPPITLTFRFCQITAYRDPAIVVTTFPDSTFVLACPHDTAEYHATARDLTGLDDPLLCAWQHEIHHILHGELRNRPSAVLWALAHDEPTDTEECATEERETQAFQRALQMRA